MDPCSLRKRAGCIDSLNLDRVPPAIQAISRPRTSDRLLSLLRIRDRVRIRVEFGSPHGTARSVFRTRQRACSYPTKPTG